ncbi:MAG TPA: enoyl-CoA hydratase-related protein [Amycolatopsis sp.]|nr:enoyl-CoA hydratase-related protein [Amycolatopsis sp.]
MTTQPTQDLDSTVLVTREGGIATLTLNRPRRKNAIDDPTWWLLRDTLAELALDADVRVLVVTGADGNFCSGADIANRDPSMHPLTRMRRIGDAALTLAEFPKPVIAKVDGVAVGAGWNLALACDFVVASTRARFSEIFAHRGLSVDVGGSWLLPRIAGLQQAKRLVLLADMIDADEALSLGLVTWVKPVDELGAFVDDVARRLAALPPMALAQSKTLLNQGASMSLRDAVENETRTQVVNFATEDAPMAARAFLDKTDPPAYTGRWAVR